MIGWHRKTIDKRIKYVLTTNIAETVTYFVGSYYEVTGSTVTKYYYAGSQRIAMRSSGTVYFLLGDHLGSTSLTPLRLGLLSLRYVINHGVKLATLGHPHLLLRPPIN